MDGFSDEALCALGISEPSGKKFKGFTKKALGNFLPDLEKFAETLYPADKDLQKWVLASATILDKRVEGKISSYGLVLLAGAIGQALHRQQMADEKHLTETAEPTPRDNLYTSPNSSERNAAVAYLRTTQGLSKKHCAAWLDAALRTLEGSSTAPLPIQQQLNPQPSLFPGS